MKKLILPVLIIMLILTSCNKSAAVDTSDTTQGISASLTPTEGVFEEKEGLEMFDTTYSNSTGFNSMLVVYGNKIFYTIDQTLFLYDISTNEKKFIDDIRRMGTYTETIFLVDDYVYYNNRYCIKRVNAETLEIETVITADEIFEQVAIKKDGFTNETKVIDNYIINDNIISVIMIAQSDDLRQPVRFSTLAITNEWNFITFQLEYPFMSSSIGRLLYNSKILWRQDMMYFDTSNGLESISQENAEYYEENISIYNRFTYNYTMNISGNIVYTSNWPNSSNNIYGMNMYTGEVVYEKNIMGAFASPYTLRQYMIFYYYDRLELLGHEEIEAEDGVVLVDTKNNNIYENEEINALLAGDIIDYNELLQMEYYLDGDILYALKKEHIFEEYDYDNFMPADFERLSDSIKINLAGELSEYISVDYIDKGEKVKLYKAEIIDGKLYFTLLYKEFE